MFCSLPFIIQFLAVKSLIIFNILLSVMLKIWFHSLPSFRGQLRSNLVDKDVANFAQWRYTNQWSYREVVLLLVMSDEHFLNEVTMSLTFFKLALLSALLVASIIRGTQLCLGDNVMPIHALVSTAVSCSFHANFCRCPRNLLHHSSK